jgi:hypothetical protein
LNNYPIIRLNYLKINFLNKHGNFFLNATYRKTVCSLVTVYVSITAIEVEVASFGAINRTRPIVAVATNIVERTITVVAVTSYR